MKMLEKSPMIAPLLERLSEHTQLYQLSDKGRDTERQELAQVMTDLLSLELKPGESELVTDVLIELTRQAEHDLRQLLAERLAGKDGIPLRMVLQLANDEISIAEPVLRNSPILQDMDLIYIIKTHGEHHWQAIARRNALNGPVIDVLADTGDLETAVVLSENTAITLTDYAMELFVPLAGQSEALARPLLARPELPKQVAARLYEAVGVELKKYIEQRFDSGVQEAIKTLDIILEETKKVTQEDFLPSEGIIKAALHMKERGQLTTTAMLSSLKRGMIASFIAQFSVFSDIAPDVVMNMLSQKTGQSLAVACRALDIKKADFLSFYLMSHRVRQAYQPVIDNHYLSIAVRTFDGILPGDALRLLREKRYQNRA